MKLRYYLRGLGIGIVVTGIVMGVSNRNAISQAKAEVRKFYEADLAEEDPADGASIVELGAAAPTESMPERNDEIESEIQSAVEGALAAENQTKPSSGEPSQEAAGASQPASSGEEPPVVVINPSNDAASSEGTAIEGIALGGASIGNTSGNTSIEGITTEGIKIEVSNGDDSGTVSRKLYNAGIIDNAFDYDAFLVQHGYDKRINPGTKVIYEGDTWQTIAEKLAKQ